MSKQIALYFYLTLLGMIAVFSDKLFKGMVVMFLALIYLEANGEK